MLTKEFYKFFTTFCYCLS